MLSGNPGSCGHARCYLVKACDTNANPRKDGQPRGAFQVTHRIQSGGFTHDHTYACRDRLLDTTSFPLALSLSLSLPLCSKSNCTERLVRCVRISRSARAASHCPSTFPFLLYPSRVFCVCVQGTTRRGGIGLRQEIDA